MNLITIQPKHHESFIQLAGIQKGILLNISHTYSFREDEGPYAFRLEKRQIDKILKCINKIISRPTQTHKTVMTVRCGDKKKRKFIVKSSTNSYQGAEIILNDCSIDMSMDETILFSIRMQEEMFLKLDNVNPACSKKIVLVSDQDTTQFEFELLKGRLHMVIIQKHFMKGTARGGVIYEFFPDIHDLMKLKHMLSKDHSRPDNETSFSTKLSEIIDLTLRCEYYQDVLNLFVLKDNIKQCHIQIGLGKELKLLEDYVTNAIYKF